MRSKENGPAERRGQVYGVEAPPGRGRQILRIASTLIQSLIVVFALIVGLLNNESETFILVAFFSVGPWPKSSIEAQFFNL